MLNDIKWYIKEEYNTSISNILLSQNSGKVFKKNQTIHFFCNRNGLAWAVLQSAVLLKK